MWWDHTNYHLEFSSPWGRLKPKSSGDRRSAAAAKPLNCASTRMVDMMTMPLGSEESDARGATKKIQ